MIYKYNVQTNTIFHDSIMLPLFEQGHYGFEIQGLLDDDLREVFSTKKIKINNPILTTMNFNNSNISKLVARLTYTPAG